jgi:hypothetical protein
MDQRAATHWDSPLVCWVAFGRSWPLPSRYMGVRSKADPSLSVIGPTIEKYLVKSSMQFGPDTGSALFWVVHVINVRL